MIELNPENNLGTLVENQFGDHYLFSVNRKLIEKIDYQTLFNKEFGQSFNAKDTLYIISGTDSGLLVKELIKNPPKPGSAYLFIEFPEIIELCQSQYDLEEHKRIVVTTEDKWIEEAKKIGLETYFFINKVSHIKSLATQYYHLGEYLFLKQAIDDSVSQLIWKYQTQLGGQTFVQKQLENIAENHTPAIELQDHFKGKSALILAGGPSLDNYIEWIEENQDKYLVIAVTRIARRLLQTKIKPDIFVSVDPNPVSFNVSKEVFNFEKNSLLVHQFHMSPMLLGNWLGANLYLGPLFPWDTKLNKKNLDGVGPTVTNTAIFYAIQMGIKQQILLGVDLCYNPEGYTHANGSNEHDNGPSINEIGQIVTTNKGEKAETNSAYYEAITTIEILAELAKKSGGQLINPSPDSATMKDVEHICIQDIKVQHEKISIADFLQQKIEQQKNSNYKVKHYKSVLKELNTAQFKVDKIEELANKGLEYNKKFFAGDGPTANFKYKLKMDKLEKELNRKSLVNYTELAKKFGINEFLYFLNPDKEREWTDEEIKKSADTYYKALRTGAIELGRHIFTTVNRTEIRLLENNQLRIDDKLIKRHLCSFDKSYLLDRQIENKKKNIKKKYDKQSLEQKKNDLVHLEQLIKSKNKTIKYCEKIVKANLNTDNSLGLTPNERNNSLIFFILMLQNRENYHSMRLNILAKNNPDIFFTSELASYFGETPQRMIESQKKINNLLKYQSKTENTFKIIKQFENLPHNYLSARLLKNHFKGKSALILANTEIVKQHLEWIEENQKYFLVLTVSKMTKYLSLTQIKPDLIIASNYDELKYLEGKEIINFEKNSLLINQNYLHPFLLGNWLGVNLYLGSIFPWKTKKDRKEITVKNGTMCDDLSTAKLFAEFMGIEQIITFDIQTDSHAQINFESRDKSVESKKEVISISKIHKKLLKQVKDPSFKVHHYNFLLDELQKTQSKVKVLENICNTVLKLNDSITINDKLTKNSSLKQEIKSLNTQLNTHEFITLKKLSIKLSVNDLFSIKKIIITDDLPPQDYKKLTFIYYKTILSGTIELLRLIFTAINRVEICLFAQGNLTLNDTSIKRHLSNTDMCTSLDNLPTETKNLVKDEITRVLDKYLEDSNKQNLEAITLYLIMLDTILYKQYRKFQLYEQDSAEFLNIAEQTIIYNNHTAKDILALNKKSINNIYHLLDHEKSKIQLEGLEIKLYNLFTLKDKSSIKQIINGINLTHNKLPEWESFLHLAKGYDYELGNKLEQAISEYGLADNTKTIESALKRLTLITLNKGELEYAHSFIKTLAEISPAYLTQLAELYVITKNYKDALDVYTQYLDYNPSDISVLLKVGKLYEEQNIRDGSEFIYKQILKLEPDNKIAKESLNNL